MGCMGLHHLCQSRQEVLQDGASESIKLRCIRQAVQIGITAYLEGTKLTTNELLRIVSALTQGFLDATIDLW